MGDYRKPRIGGMSYVHVITGCVFLCTLVCYFERMGFSIAFTEIAKAENLTESVKGHVLSAFFYGYAAMQLPGGWLAARHGGTRILGLSFSLWGIISLFTPGTVYASNTTFMAACRVAIGASQGLFIPASHTLLAQWVPVHERSRLVTLSMSGMYLGSALSMLFVPNLTKHFGPKAQFVLSGLLALAWQAMWSKVGADNTDDIITGGDSKTDGTVTPVQMDEEGGEYIAQPFNDGTTPLLLPSRSLSNGTGRPSVRGSSRSLTSSPPVSEMNTGGVAGSRVEVGTGGGVPWGVMIQSSAVWAIVANNFAFHYATYVLMNWIPTYFESHVGAPLSDMGDQYKVMPYVMMFIASNMGGSLGTWVHVSWGKSIVFSRKCVNTLGFSLATVSLLLMPRATHWKDGLLYTTMALSALGFSRGGWAVNHMDIAPRHAGVVMAIANGAGTLAGIVGVSWTGKVLEAMGGSTEPLAWSIALGAVALVCASALVVFLVLARGETLFH